MPFAPDDIDSVLGCARALRFLTEDQGPNRSTGIDAMNRMIGVPMGSPWCASFVAWCGDAALGSEWPVPKTASCYQLGEWARTEQRLLMPREARRGDLFLIWSPRLNRFAHVGFVTGASAGGRIETIEGNTNEGGSRDGWGVFSRIRTLGPNDRIVRWA